LAEEVAQLRPWHDLAVRRRGGSSAGISGLAPEQAAAYVVSFLGASPPADPRPGQPPAESLKFACADLRAFYEEAATAQPGNLSADAMEAWFYLQTVAGEVIRAVRLARLHDADPAMRLLAEKLLVPRAVLHRIGG
jgi:D-proline reductase (dithiol) PrdB